MSFDEIGIRMKENYENPSKRFLPKKSNVIIRIDGKAFHTYTRGFQKPYDPVISYAMCNTMKELCSNIQGARFGYTQSDEITIVLHDKMSIKSDAWFGYNQSKMESISASIATFVFNQTIRDHIPDIERRALFDSRSFHIPLDYEVLNCLLWRQLDAARNSIQGYAQSMFSHKELMNKNIKEMQEMMFQKNGFNWGTISAEKRIGWMCLKDKDGIWNVLPSADLRTDEGKKIISDAIFPDGILK